MTSLLHLSRFTPDPSRFGEYLACLWQGEVPPTFTLRQWLHVEAPPLTMLLLWEGDDTALAYVERTFGQFGDLRTEAVVDATAAMQLALDRDLDGFGAWMRGRGTAPDEVDRQLDVRRRGMAAASHDAAKAAGRAWSDDRNV